MSKEQAIQAARQLQLDEPEFFKRVRPRPDIGGRWVVDLWVTDFAGFTAATVADVLGSVQKLTEKAGV